MIDDNTQVQTSNAIFTIPANIVFFENEETIPLAPIVIVLLSFFILFILLFMLRNKVKYQMLEPIHKLKDYSEAILKGDYEQKADYGRTDEIGAIPVMK